MVGGEQNGGAPPGVEGDEDEDAALSLSHTHFLCEREDDEVRWLLLQIQPTSSITSCGELT
jgi:hypothetical protein